MEICSILVNMDPGNADSPSLRYAIRLAQIFDAELIGLAAEEQGVGFYADEHGLAALDVFALERAEVVERLKQAEAAFHSIVPSSIATRWKAFVADPVSCLVEEAGSSDVIVTSPTIGRAPSGREKMDLGELILRAGRPVVDVSRGYRPSVLDTIVIGWKNTREARRAVADAAPFLRRAKTVIVLAVSEGAASDESDGLAALLAWLDRHGVEASGELIGATSGIAQTLAAAAIERRADLVVTGGYGHSRTREWIFGGTTRSLLGTTTVNRLFSH
jgi:nucleotide-binding universal stress UspA family protein